MFIVLAICKYGDEVDIILWCLTYLLVFMSTCSKIFDSNLDLIRASALRWASTLQSNFFNIQVTEHSLSKCS